MAIDYEELTETPGAKATNEQLRRMFTRYHFAREFCREKKVLEVACGSGQGLRYIREEAGTVIGGDYTFNMLSAAKAVNKNRLPLLCLDAQALPFRDGIFDVVILYEAIYYLRKAEDFIWESRRVLKKNGIVIICLPNKSLPDFHPSPYSFNYYTPQELRDLIEPKGFELSLFGDCPVDYASLKSKLFSMVKKTIVRWHLMPKTLKGRELLKRLVFGRLTPIPAEIERDLYEYTAPSPLLPESEECPYRVLYAVARLIQR